MSDPQTEETDRSGPHIIVVVTRSGGIAGMTRQWRARPAPVDAPRWVSLIDDCPWSEPITADSAAGGDRFLWRIRASLDGDASAREAQVPDSRLDGPWRALVDEVQTTES